MIHLFDGFTWPSNKQANHNDSEVLSHFTFPISAPQGEQVSSGAGSLSTLGSSSTARSFRILSKKTVPTSPVLVLGVRAKFPMVGSRTTWGAILGFAFSTSTISLLYSSNPLGISTTLPGFLVGRHSTASQHGLCVSAPNQTLQYVASQNVIVPGSYQPLTGIDMGESHMYEVEYRFNDNLINIYVDGIKIVEAPYTFTTLHKTTAFPLYVYGLADNDSCAGSLENVYLADTRLGPVKVVSKRATSDVSADSVFGAGPHAPKVNTTSDGTSRMATKATGDALFNLNGTVNSDVQAINMIGRFSTKHLSAQETEATAGFNLMGGSGVWKSPKQSIPSASYRQDVVLLEQNPTTGQKWTQAEINAMQAGFGIEVRDRYPS